MTYDGIYSRSKLVNKLIWLKATYCDVCVCGTYVHVVVHGGARAHARDLTSLTTKYLLPPLSQSASPKTR